jgi:hypothetical protein
MARTGEMIHHAECLSGNLSDNDNLEDREEVVKIT